MPSRKKPSRLETRRAMINSLREWNVEARDGDFRQQAIQQALACLDDDSEICSGDDNNEMIPKSRKEAIMHVLFADFQDHVESHSEECLIVPMCFKVDALVEFVVQDEKKESISFNAPFFIGKDRYSGEEKPFPCKQFRGLPRLSPLERFSLQENTLKRLESMSLAEYAFHMTIGTPGWADGNVFEAMVATHAVYNEACYGCKMQKCLRWCGGSSASWRDLHCNFCGSCFEIKSKGSKEAIEKAFRYKFINGGSFRRWCRSPEDFQENRAGKDYVVFVNRAKTLPRGARTVHEMVHDVEIAEIANITPRLTANSFYDRVEKKKAPKEEKYISIASHAHIRCSTRAVWFNIPAREQVNPDDMAREAFERFFPGQWDALHGSNNHDKSEEKKSTQRNRIQEVDIESIRKDLELLKTTNHVADGSDDEWENLYDSE